MDKNHADKEHEQALEELQTYLDKRDKETQEKEKSKSGKKDPLSFGTSDIFIILLWIAIAISLFIAFNIEEVGPYETPSGYLIGSLLLIVNIIYSIFKTPKTNFQKANLVITTIATMIVAGPLILVFILSMPFLLIIPIIIFIIYKMITKNGDVEKNLDNNSTKDNKNHNNYTESRL